MSQHAPWPAVASLLAVFGAASCAALAGLDEEYVTGEVGGSGATGTASTSTGGTGGTTPTGGSGGSGVAGTGGTSTGGTGVAGGGGSGAGDIYLDEVLADGPLAFWRFGESAGPTAYDSSGHDRHATYVEPITYGVTGALTGNPNTAVQFPGSVADVHHDMDFDDFSGNAPYTLETWFKADSYDGAYRHLFNKDFTGGNGRHNIGLFVTTGEQLGFERIIAGDKEQADALLPPEDTWTHIVGTYDGAELKLYVDAVLQETTADGRAQDSKPVSTYVGAKAPDHNVLFGYLDEFAIYGHALSAQRVKAHYDAGRGL